jgi:uncharacterized protein YkwD
MSQSKSNVPQRVGKLTLAIAVLAVAVPAAAAADCPNAKLRPVASNVNRIRAAVLCMTNADRARRGLIALTENSKLRRAARAHSSDMVDDGYFDHTTPAGADFVDRIVRTGYVSRHGDWKLGENLAWGSGVRGTAGRIQRAWMRSRGHKRTILKAAYREIGIGISLGVPTGNGAGATFTTDFGAKP